MAIAVVVPDSQCDQERPELGMNRAVLLEVFFASAASGIGTIGFVWATVVLLGGFETELNQVDFWFITALSFFQAIRLFGGDWNADQKILFGLPLDALSQPKANGCSFLLCCLNYASCYTPKLSCLLFSGKVVCIFSAFLVRFLKFVVILGTLILSVARLILGNVAPHAEAANLKSAFSLYYGLSIVQAVVSYMAFSYSHAQQDMVQDIRDKYNFAAGDVEDEPFLVYYAHLKKICKAGGIAETLNMTLPAFAVASLGSNEQQVRVAAIKILQYLVQERDYKEQTLSAIRDSFGAAASLFRTMALTSQDKTSREAREGATSIMVELAGDLHISGLIPCATQSIYSLLKTSSRRRLDGMKILERLSTKNCNLADISSSDELMSKIIEFTEPKISRGVSTMADDGFQMAERALLVLTRLGGQTGEQGSMMRQVILRNVFLMSNIKEMLQGANNNDRRLQEMQKRGMGIVDGFALDSESRNHGAIIKILTLVLNIFRHGPNNEFRLAAGKTLARLTTESRVNCDAILTKENFQALRDTLFEVSERAHLVIAANILKNLCENCEAQHGQHDALLGFVQDNMEKILEAMYQLGSGDLIGEDMGTFLGLILQLSKLVTVADFNTYVAANGNGGDRRDFIQKLKSILERANEQETGVREMHPGIRRFTIELAIWMAQTWEQPQFHWKQRLEDCGMRSALVEAEQTARRAPWREDCKLSPGGVPVLEYEQSLHSLASRALELIR
ncbi:uncharacterized protein LOC121055510 [Oryza brachyantha]|uniref:Uncharacterized protein n=1 Tax=Oryza brachyantha TaxID=4533 RepID=J3N3X9_ORYBR|nr:uncharacterized protein LOC121055510 [Oryza brachyantha]